MLPLLDRFRARDFLPAFCSRRRERERERKGKNGRERLFSARRCLKGTFFMNYSATSAAECRCVDAKEVIKCVV